MKLITYGGLPTKNSPISSREAYMLALKSRFITGIAVDLYYTNYKEIIALADENLKRLSLTEQELLDKSPDEIRRLNIGNMVKIHNLLSLTDILDLYTKTQTTDSLVLSLENSTDNAEFVDEVLSILKEYSWVDVYIKSPSSEIYSYLSTSRDKADFKLGAIIDNYNKVNLALDYDVDFFSVRGNILKREEVERLLVKHEVMYENVDYIVDFSNLIATLGVELSEKIAVITDIVAMVYANYGVLL